MLHQTNHTAGKWHFIYKECMNCIMYVCVGGNGEKECVCLLVKRPCVHNLLAFSALISALMSNSFKPTDLKIGVLVRRRS